MSASRRKGTRGEVLAVAFLAEELGPQVERRVMGGINDRGDVAGIEKVCIEVKWHKAMDLGTWMREAELEAVRGGIALPVVMHNRIRARARDNYATVPWWVLRYFLRLHLDDVARRRLAKEAS